MAAAGLAGLLLLGGGTGGYTVKARFQNASQLVKGNLVQVSGQEIGKVETIDLTADGQAEITMSIDEDHAPLRRGTRAIVRQASLSGIANRYVDLTLPAQGAARIPDGGTIGQDATTSAVDLDQVFNTFDPDTRKDLQAVLKGSQKQHEGQGDAMNEGLLHLNPSLSASSKLFNELNRDTPLLERFLVASSKLVTDVAERRDDLAGVVDHLATPGTSRETVPEGGELPDGQVKRTVELDEIFDSLDPATRAAFEGWQTELAKGIEGRGRDFNDALGTLPGFAADGADVLEVLDTQEGAVTRLVKNSGVVFGALTENEAQLRNLITGSKATFDATAAKNDALAETIRILPTFLKESKLALARVQTFSQDTNPLITDLRPVARDLQPTLRDVRALAPDLEAFFRDLDPVITASKTGMPATREVLAGAQPLLGELGPFLSQINPILKYLEASQWQVADFLNYGAAALSAKTVSPGGGAGHYLRQFGPLGAESASIWKQRAPGNRGNSYVQPLSLAPTKTDAGRTYDRFKVTAQFRLRELGREARAERRYAGLPHPEQEPVRPWLPVLVQRPEARGRVPARGGRRLHVAGLRREPLTATPLPRPCARRPARSRRARRPRARGGR